MDKILDMISLWSREGQGLFLFLMALITAGTFLSLIKYLVCLVRGWPPIDDDDAEDPE